MMQVSNVKTAKSTTQAASRQANTAADTASKDIQSKILNAQKQSQGLSFNMEMTAEEKANFRQKIQQEISDLKRELRQRQLEEERKEQEAKKALEKKEQQEAASQESVPKERQKIQSGQEINDRQQDSVSGSKKSQKGSELDKDREDRNILHGGMQKIISADSTVRQYRAVSNAAAQNDKAVRVQEQEMRQDEVRGSDVDAVKKEQRADLQKEARRMEMMKTFMFEGKSKTTEPAAGIAKPQPMISRGKGLYDNNAMLFKTNFQSVELDLRQ